MQHPKEAQEPAEKDTVFTQTGPQGRRLVFRLPPSLGAGLCWIAVLTLLLTTDLRADPRFLAPQRLMFLVLLLLAGLLTFKPLQQRLGLPGLVWEGVGGTTLLLYTLAFVPPPTASLLFLPDLPVYLLLFCGLFWATTASALPFVYVFNKRYVPSQTARMILKLARRQASELGLLVALIAGLAGLRALNWGSFSGLILTLFLAEFILQKRIKTG